MKYHRTEAPKTVGNEQAEAELGGAWKDSPAEFDTDDESPQAQRVILTDLPKLNGDTDTLIVPAEAGEIDEPAEPVGDVTEPKSGKKKK